MARWRRATRAVWHTLAIWLAATLTLGVLALVMPGFRPGGDPHRGPVGALVAAGSAAAVFGVLSAVVWPRVVRALLLVPSFVMAALVFLLNGGLVIAALQLARDYGSLDVPAAVIVAATLSLVMSATHSALAARDDAAYRSRLARLAGRRVVRRAPGATPGVVFVQLDGLGHDVLRLAVNSGHMPTLASWLGTGTHRVVPWRTDWSSQTGASQLGILHGTNHDVPAFRWYEKDTRRLMVCSRPATVAELERRAAAAGRPGLLARDGASRGNLFTGGAARSALVVSVSGHGRRDRTGYFAYFSDPAAATRTVASFVAEVARELVSSARARWRDERPRVRRGGLYPLIRAFATVVERDVVVSAVIGDVLAGRSVVYADLIGYDEVAHHSGVRHPDTMTVLRRLDRSVALINDVARHAPRPYEIVLVSDHGQSPGEPFAARYGLSLDELVLRATTDSTAPPVDPTVDTGRGAEARAVARLALTGAPPLPAERPAGHSERPIVLASGNLGLVSFPGSEHRLSRDEIEELHPGLIDTVASHPGIGFVLVRDAERGPLVVGADGERELATGEVLGVDPLAPFGPGAAAAVLRTDAFPHCPDLMINSRVDPATGEVHAFEAQVGSHGGLGGPQGTAFVLHPAHLSPPAEPIVGAAAVHDLFASWLVELQGAADPDEPVDAPHPTAHPVDAPHPTAHPVDAPHPTAHPVDAPHPTAHPVDTSRLSAGPADLDDADEPGDVAVGQGRLGNRPKSGRRRDV